MEIFRYLIEKGAPISPVGAKFNPLFIGIKKRNIEIVSTLLVLGADPNSNMFTKNNNPYCPLDVAISTGFTEALTLLIMFGANTSQVDRKRITDPVIIALLDQMAFPNALNRNQLENSVKRVDSKLAMLKSGINTFSQELKKLHCSSPTAVVKTLNEVRKLFSDLTQFMNDATELSAEIDNSAKSLLQRQLQIFNESQALPIQNSGLCFNGGRILDDALESEWRNNRLKIAEIDLSVHQFTETATKAISLIENLKVKSLEFIETATKELTELKNELESTEITTPIMLRMGFNKEASEIIANDSIERIKVIEETLELLHEHKKKCEEICKTIVSVIREAAK